MMDINISEESFERVLLATENIKECCDIKELYTEWSDSAQEFISESFENLDDNQIYMTYAAWESFISDNKDINLAKGLVLALRVCINEYIHLKEMFILECNLDPNDDDYYDTEAVILKKAFEECLECANELFIKINERG